ncbi:hypothetical protein K443DRAFT_121764 [Laccaria amethystina LaAM-08-1]|uniref:Uncharacterized protein n=1 Tax=Laccaria amethystina LaAM-08-1 TaxID=1095629 RepID=A0A0C9XMW1_9AGAR|nr:hypothetical protein K443DRAFT_121764 [Laccaria amethystina LaAM-08-1]
MFIDPGEMDMQVVRKRLMEVNEWIMEAEESSDAKNCTHNVLIETLRTGTLGLPQAAEPLYMVCSPSGVAQEVVHHPPIHVLKHRSDEGDIDYMVHWLAQNRLTIQFGEYKGKEGVEERLRSIVERGDWEVLEGMEIWGGQVVYFNLQASYLQNRCVVCAQEMIEYLKEDRNSSTVKMVYQ